jgi:DNA-binding beta-propeller fold protein YncE
MRFRLAVLVALSALVAAATPSHSQTPAFVTMWGSFGSGPGQLQYPYGIVASADGFLYVTDQYNFRIVKYTPTGQVVTSWGSQGNGPGQFGITIGLGIDASGKVYVADYGNNRVQVFDGNGGFIRQWALFTARDVAVAPDGRVHVVSQGGGFVGVYTQEGTPVYSYGAGFLNGPASIAFDAAGNAFVAEEYQARISRWTPGGVLVTSWGAAGEGPGQFGGLVAVTVDPAGRVHAVDHGLNRVTTFTSAGVLQSTWGTTGSGPAQFDHAADVAVDALGFIYIVDMHNHRVQKFSTPTSDVRRSTWGAVKLSYR